VIPRVYVVNNQEPSVMIMQPTQAAQVGEKSVPSLTFMTCSPELPAPKRISLTCVLFSGTNTEKNAKVTKNTVAQESGSKGQFSASSWAQGTTVWGSWSLLHIVHNAMVGEGSPGSDCRMGNSRRDSETDPWQQQAQSFRLPCCPACKPHKHDMEASSL
jgi:hypothetical protein